MSTSWMKVGKASEAMAKQEEAEKQLQKEQYGNLWRFYLKDKEEGRITFIDGDLDDEGRLIPPRYYEHSLQINGKWGNFYVCPEKTEPEAGHKCPLCAAGDRATLVAVFTVIDHRSYTNAAGKVFPLKRKLLVAKSQSMEMLSKLATKRGGLAGVTFDVSRMGDTSASIGSMFAFVEKNKPEDLIKAYTEEYEDKNKVMKTRTLFMPADYEAEIVFRTPEEMLKLGLGAHHGHSHGSNAGSMSPGGAGGKNTDYSKSL